MFHSRCDGLDRRDFLRVGGLSAFGLGLGQFANLQRLQAAGSTRLPAKAKNCILIWLDGGPSHMETFDPKPDTPAEVRGPLGTVKTGVPGVEFSECLPKSAKLFNQLAVVR